MAGTLLRGQAGRRGVLVVLGFMFRVGVAGVVWQALHYLLGLRRLGFDTYYLECHGQGVADPADTLAARCLDQAGLTGRWSLWVEPSGRSTLGLDAERMRAVCRAADAVINLSGYHAIQRYDIFDDSPRRIYVETDPVKPQIRVSQGDPFQRSLLDAHTHHFTFATRVGSSGSTIPETPYRYRPTRQPVLIDEWAASTDPGCPRFTTVGRWKQRSGRSVDGVRYRWSKDLEFVKFLDLPSRTRQPFELALARMSEEDRRMLKYAGWLVRDAAAVSGSLEAYRRYIRRSRAEFTVAKELNLRFRSGWFSDRSACYLAAGKPVVTQDTGFGLDLPTGEGLFAFRTMDDILAAVDAINSDYRRHSQAARDLAAAYFDAPVVLGDLLREADLA
jgi:hypothetical protein